MQGNRPFGVSLLSFVLVVASLSTGLLLFLNRGEIPLSFSSSPTPPSLIIDGLALLALLELLLAWGLWTTKGWARNGVILMELGAVVLGFLAFSQVSQLFGLLNLALFIVLLSIYVLFNRGVRQAFGP